MAETKQKPFAFEVAEVEKTKTTTVRKADEQYRPIFDALAKLDEGSQLIVTFDDEARANAAKLTVQLLANEAGWTARERRGSRETLENDNVRIALVKRPRQRRETDPKPAQTDAPAE